MITRDVNELPVNYALLQLVGAAIPTESEQPAPPIQIPEKTKHYESAKRCIEEIALYLKPMSEGKEGISGLFFFQCKSTVNVLNFMVYSF